LKVNASALLAVYALDCTNLLLQNKKHNYFSPEKEEKKICKFNSNGAAAVKVFGKKYYPKHSEGVEIF
jgi:hypothetical protein